MQTKRTQELRYQGEVNLQGTNYNITIQDSNYRMALHSEDF